jgi:hypothetical protein
MKHPDTRNTPSRWRAFGSMALAAAVVAMIGFTSVAPAKADDDDWAYRRGWRDRERHEEWRERREEWRERHPYAGIYFYSPTPYGSYDYYYYR